MSGFVKKEVPSNISKWFRGPEKTKYIPKLPPLGDALLKMLIEYYGADSVCKASYYFVKCVEKEEIITQAKDELENTLLAIKEINKKNV